MSKEHKHHFGTINVLGEGRVTLRPDIATVRLGVRSQAKTAREAAAQNAAIAARIVAAVGAVGIAEDAIQTVSLTLEPNYEWDESNKINVLVGYRASDNIRVRAPIGAIAEVYDAGVAAGANDGGEVTFGLTDATQARQEALKQATKQALERSEQVARTLQVDLEGPIEVQILEAADAQPREVTRAAVSPATPIMPGELEVIERVRVMFQTKI